MPCCTASRTDGGPRPRFFRGCCHPVGESVKAARLFPLIALNGGIPPRVPLSRSRSWKSRVPDGI